jgi:hypothetical protein
MIALMQVGPPWQEAVAMARVQVCRSTADHLYRELCHRQDELVAQEVADQLLLPKTYQKVG